MLMTSLFSSHGFFCLRKIGFHLRHLNVKNVDDVFFSFFPRPTSHPLVLEQPVAPPRGGGGGGAPPPPPNVFQSVVLDSYKSDELRRRGVVLYVTMFFEVIKSQTTVSYAMY